MQEGRGGVRKEERAIEGKGEHIRCCSLVT